MNRVEFCVLTLQSGMDAEPRGKAALSCELQHSAAIYDPKHEKRAVSDLDTLSNPNADIRTFHRSSEQKMNALSAGIGIETTERILADRLNENVSSVKPTCAHPPLMVGRSLFLFSVACPG